ARGFGGDAQGQCVEAKVELQVFRLRSLNLRGRFLRGSYRNWKQQGQGEQAGPPHCPPPRAARPSPTNSQPSASNEAKPASGSERTPGISIVSAHHRASSRSAALIWPESGPNRM